MRKVELRPLEPNHPGYGQLAIIGWQGEGEGLSIDIQRNQDEYFLQDDGEWRSNAFRFHLPALQSNDNSHVATVDHKIVDPLLESTHATNMVRLYGPDGSQVGQARLRIGKGLMPSGASGSAPELESSAALNTPQPVPPSTPEPTIEPAQLATEASSAEPGPPPEHPEPPPEPPASAPSPRGKRGLWLLLMVLVAVAILAAAAWFALNMRDTDQPSQESSNSVEEASEPEAEPLATEEEASELSNEYAPEPPAQDREMTTASPCSLQRMGEMGELEFVQFCTNSDHPASDMLEVISSARDNNHCSIARRLYAHQALNGDIASALAYARELDPSQHSPSACFPAPDAETAIFWYETALGLDPDNHEANQRLEALQE